MKTLERQSLNLDPLLAEILRECASELARIDPLRVGALASTWGPGLGGSGARGRSAATGQQAPRAESELVRVHRSELAFLLREGARRCDSWCPADAQAWRGLVGEALTAARSDDLDLAALTPSSLNLAPGGVAPGLDAVELARASLSLAEHPLGRLELGLALQRRGHPRAASGVFAAALYGLAHLPGVLRARPWPDLIGGLAEAQEHSGHPTRARLLRRWLPGRVA